MSRSGSLTPGVQLGDRRVVPLHDLAHEDVGDQRTGELELARDTGNLVDRHHRAEHGRQVEDLARRVLDLVGRHRAVGGAEEHRLVGQLADAGAGTERLVVDQDARLELGVLGEPLRIDRRREGGAGAVDLGALGEQANRGCRRRQRRGKGRHRVAAGHPGNEHVCLLRANDPRNSRACAPRSAARSGGPVRNPCTSPARRRAGWRSRPWRRTSSASRRRRQ